MDVKPRRPRKRRKLQEVVEGVMLLTGGCTIAGFFGAGGVFFDLASHFRFQYLWIQLLCAAVFVVARRWKLMAVTIIFAGINIFQIAPLYIPRPPASSQTAAPRAQVRLLQINVYGSNRDYARTIDLIEKLDPDMIALEEIDREWLSALSAVLTGYPYEEYLARMDTFGIGLFSRIPFRKSEIRYFGDARVPSIISEVVVSDEPVTVLLTHPHPPASLKYFRWRNDQLQDIVSARGDFNERLIVVGDLNMASWSHYFTWFVSSMNLCDSRRGFGIQPTWPTFFRAAPFMITLDHCLTSSNFRIRERRVCEDIGSDHYPIYIELELAR